MNQHHRPEQHGLVDKVDKQGVPPQKGDLLRQSELWDFETQKELVPHKNPDQYGTEPREETDNILRVHGQMQMGLEVAVDKVGREVAAMVSGDDQDAQDQ